MIRELEAIRNYLAERGGDRMETVELYRGIELSYVNITGCEQLSFRGLKGYDDAFDRVLVIGHCRRGRIGIKTGNGSSVYLGQTDICVHSMKVCADAELFLPTESFEGVVVCVDLRGLSERPPEILSGTGIDGELLYEKFCKEGTIVSVAGNEKTERIFSALYSCPERLRLAYQKLRVTELLLYLGVSETLSESRLTEYRSEQTEVIRRIHDQLTEHIDRRFTIAELSKQYLMNPTTLKAAFKSVYGTSIAAHIKEHRMELAAKLLRETELSIAEIAARVGYDSQSKFTSAFKEYCGKLPKDYRNS